jgi:hypothetical protein
MHRRYLPKIDRFVMLLNILSLFFNTLFCAVFNNRNSKQALSKSFLYVLL